MTDLAFRFAALNKADNQIKGIIYAPNQDMAWVKIRKAGLRPQSTNLDPMATVSGFLNEDFNQRDLAMFYDTIGKRIQSGRPLVEGLDSASSFILDPRLRQAALLTSQSVTDGALMSQAMVTAGFPSRDCMAIRAAEDSGKQGEAFVAMAKEVSRRADLAGKLKAMFTMPVIMMTFMYFAIFASAWKLIPQIKKFVMNLGPAAMKSMDSPAQQAMFWLSDKVEASFFLTFITWCALPLLIFYSWKKGYLAKFGDNIESWREISEKSDMASTWTAFGMLYDAGVSPFEAANTVKPSAARYQTKISFSLLNKALLKGNTVSESVRRSDFPTYIITSIKAAESSGFPLPDEIRAMCERLQDDVGQLTTRFQKKMELWSLILLASMVMLFFSATIGPLMSFGFKGV